MAKKQTTINHSLDDLRKLSETPILFLQIVQANKWHRMLYTGMDLEHNAKVRFVREWYFKTTGQKD